MLLHNNVVMEAIATLELGKKLNEKKINTVNEIGKLLSEE